jgi:hypothetical protein
MHNMIIEIEENVRLEVCFDVLTFPLDVSQLITTHKAIEKSRK